MLKNSTFEAIRLWAKERGLYESGDEKTQALKLVEEVGETCAAIIRGNDVEARDGIGDCVVVLVNLAHIMGTDIETCIQEAYNEIQNRKGSMKDGNFIKEEDHETADTATGD